MDNINKKPDLSYVWNILDTVLGDTFKKNEISDVILPFVVLRRIDCMLAPVNSKVREQYEKFQQMTMWYNSIIKGELPRL